MHIDCMYTHVQSKVILKNSYVYYNDSMNVISMCNDLLKVRKIYHEFKVNWVF